MTNPDPTGSDSAVPNRLARSRVSAGLIVVTLALQSGCGSNPDAPTAPSKPETPQAAPAGANAKAGEKGEQAKQATRSFD